jgi:uncharacterized membrane protein required for colicin V production
MNGIDVALVVLLLVCSLRGSWRGVFRESFGFAGLVLGLLAAARGAEAGASRLSAYSWAAELSGPALAGAAFVLIFLIVSAVVNLIGVAADQLFGRGILRMPSRIGGAVFALAKGGAVLAFLLLFLQLFPFVPGIDQQITGSRFGRPMAAAAGAALRAGWHGASDENRSA